VLACAPSLSATAPLNDGRSVLGGDAVEVWVLCRRIEAGEWAADDPLPPVGELAARYGVSRSTVNRAMRVLAGEGLGADRAAVGDVYRR
jgi:hypothetical protein